MSIARVKTWHWFAISLAIGMALALTRRTGPGGWPPAHEFVSNQAWFESQLQRTVPLADGRTIRAFDELTVYPASIDDAQHGSRPVHLIIGRYLAGTAVRPDAEAVEGKLRRYCYIAPVPYQPLGEQGTSANPQATVLDYLNGLHGHGVRYTYAWWADSRYSALMWVGGSAVLIGLLWPALVNLLVFGSFRRPAEERGIDLSRISSSSGPALPARAHGAHDMAQVDDLAADMEAKLAATADAAQPNSRAGAGSTASAAPNLSPAPLERAPVAAQPDEKSFGADPDDFYPTELKAEKDQPPPRPEKSLS